MPFYGNKNNKMYKYGYMEHEIGDYDNVYGWYKMTYTVPYYINGVMHEHINLSNFAKDNITRMDLHGTRHRLINKAHKLF